ncbi:phage holin family protein [Metabacillus litoralis]|uniref:phage holin family protein n=1 Tax=Metabacillus litoralis TaxID=152268 RepID=UPI00203ADEA2|nr:phage holin family protein [Metabacillus litoralis]MCM3411218.1 phage holin family protein [Metabacillus litoralis]
MERLDLFFKVIATVLGAISGYLWGGWSTLIQILVVFVAIDYMTGLLAAGYEGKLSSKIGFRGIAKKVMIFALVSVAHMIDKALGESHIFRDAVIFFYLGNELLSILENAGRTGLPVPDQIKNAVQVLKGKGEGKQ